MKHKKATRGAANFLNGVSTLDAKRGVLRFVLPLLLLTVLNISASVGHSILDRVDPAFNAQIETNSFTEKTVSSITPLPDGKILVTGRFNSYNRQPVGGLIRLNADATLDATFNNNVLAPGASPGTGLVVLPDGKILAYSSHLLLSGETTTNKRLIRLNSDGTVDESFNYNNANGFVTSATVDASGRVYLASTPGANPNIQRLIRLNSDGSVDSSHGTISAANVYQLAAQGNKILVAFSNLVWRLNENGNWDLSFERKIISGMLFKKLVVQPDGKVLVLEIGKLFRINADGGDDNSFTTTNFEGAKDMSVSNDGRITVSEGYTAIFYIKRFLPNGTPDPSFTTYAANNYSSFGVTADGGVFVGDMLIGLTITMRNDFVRLFPSGIRDLSFNPGGDGFQMINPGAVRAIAVQTNGKIIIGGKFDLVNDVARTKIARINADSTLDPAFQINTTPAGNYFSSVLDIYNCLVQPDGKIVVSGNFVYSLNGIEKANLVRLNADGTIDATFNLGVFVNDFSGAGGAGTNRLALFGDGGLLVAASRLVSSDRAAPYKLTASGALDTSFSPPVNPVHHSFYIFDAAIQPDGKILIGGRSATFSGASSGIKSFVMRLNADGSLDPTFQGGEVIDKEVSALALLPNGKVLIVKRNPALMAVQQSSVSRLNADGSLDASFNAGTEINGRGNALLVLPTGKIFVGGKFTSFNSQPRRNLALLNQNGSLDAQTYDINEEVLALAVDGDGRVLVGGSFTTVNVGGGQNYARSYLARLIDSSQTTGRTRFDFDGDGRADIAVFNNATGEWSYLSSLLDELRSLRFGQNGDRIAPADFDGDGKTDIAVYRPAQGTWYLMQSTAGFAAYQWGAGGDKSVANDYDGDGKADIAVWRPSNGVWYIFRSNGSPIYRHFGAADDLPVPADYDGDGKTDIAVFRPSNSTFYWLASASNNQFKGIQFGQTDDIPAIADYNGDGKADLTVFRPSTGVWHQYLTTAGGSYSYSAAQFGQNGDEPVAADYDGDGRADIAVRRQGIWHLLKSGQGYSAVSFGGANAQAVAALPNQ